MYEFIKGTIAEISPAHVVVETQGGVGYYLNISLMTYSSIGGLKEAKLYTHFIVREDAQLLYGFFDRRERELFKLLIGVSGVGGGTARMVLSSFSADELRIVISTGKAEVLKGVKGLGLKTAQKIIVELKDKVLSIASGSDTPLLVSATESPVLGEALSAMLMLGFAKAPAEKVLRKVIENNPDAGVEQIIRYALKQM